MQKRGWDVKTTGVMAITADELDTARRRTTGSMDAIKAAGFPKQIYKIRPNLMISWRIRCR
jgi:L-arabinose transport system substrate-binding protein